MPFSLSLGLTDDLTEPSKRWTTWRLDYNREIVVPGPNEDYYVTREICYGGMHPKFLWHSDDNTAILW